MRKDFKSYTYETNLLLLKQQMSLNLLLKAVVSVVSKVHRRRRAIG